MSNEARFRASGYKTNVQDFDMRILLTAALAALITITSGSNAEAAKGGIYMRTKGELFFVADTQIPSSDGTTLSLCTLAKQRSISGLLNVWVSPKSYALAENRCDTEQYLPLEGAMLPEAIQMGAIPADVPLEPSLSIVQRIKGAWFSLAMGLVLIYGLVQRLRGAGPAPARARRS
ncbi:MAG: hypothetical protein HUJ27_14715 [Rhodobacteraceae bacterium]|nr:hypothetical protein [Paracoccaceae bacterium]